MVHMKSKALDSLTHPVWRHFYLVGMDVPYHQFAGVYMIGDAYIGASIAVKKRLKSHYLELRRNHHSNKELTRLYLDHLESGIKIPVKILDDNPYNEYYWKKKYDMIYYPHERFYHQQYAKEARK